jgi:hypothetical protein
MLIFVFLPSLKTPWKLFVRTTQWMTQSDARAKGPCLRGRTNRQSSHPKRSKWKEEDVVNILERGANIIYCMRDDGCTYLVSKEVKTPEIVVEVRRNKFIEFSDSTIMLGLITAITCGVLGANACYRSSRLKTRSFNINYTDSTLVLS